PLLGPLQDNGGSGGTHALSVASPAINAGDPDLDPASFDPPLLFDQRGEGFARVSGERLDIGAFEYRINQPPTLSLPAEPVAVTEGQWTVLADLPVTVSDSDAGDAELTMVFEIL